MRVPAGERGEGAVPARQGNTGGRGERAAGGRSRHGESRRSLPFLPRARAVGIIGFARHFFPIFVFKRIQILFPTMRFTTNVLQRRHTPYNHIQLSPVVKTHLSPSRYAVTSTGSSTTWWSCSR